MEREERLQRIEREERNRFKSVSNIITDLIIENNSLLCDHRQL